ncbi:tRNA (34-2'-O)-methyltransferase regulator WDR6 isoform X2 [Parambassis ranga]|uniref:tRNA (34-2'-O)-methyltransferase regulator WDR6 n=1 Tax=Parambassis ranga TaxID=210632 RepID=A0A6P7HUU7_9TELE|nr:WD repeat-containing protein 6 isoform X2 [Parambassis ranga]XP_028252379.1 WD repeat-containing protein 6 isoform X2 [Parambassis ranga]
MELETAALVAPVTSLEFIQDSFLLTGEGPVLSVYTLQPHPDACASVNVLQHYRIHGIRPRPVKKHGQSSTTEPNLFDLAVVGGKAVRLVRLHLDLQDEHQLYFEVLGPLMKLQDWVLDVRWLSGDKQQLLCVAVAHSSVVLLDSVTGNALIQRSCTEGCLLYSALLLVHESWADTVIVGGTVFNQLVLWKPGGGDESSGSEQRASVERRLLGHSGVIFSITYLQEKGYLASASDDRSVRVWGVGTLGGPGGICGDMNPTCLQVLYGHHARVFSVHLSLGKVFSAGEDGACLMWDWTGGGRVVRTLKGHRAGGVRALAVSERTGDGERWVATGGADGGVRLWRVDDSEESVQEAVTEKLTDLKFPDHGLPKVVCIAAAEDENTSWSRSKIEVCTDRGVVCQYSDGKWTILWQGTAEFQSYCVMETVTVKVKDSSTKAHLCAVGNLTGSIQVFTTSHPQSGHLLTGGAGKIHSLLWHKEKEHVYLLASSAEGIVYRWCIEVTLNEDCLLVLNINPFPSFLLPACAKRWLTAAVCLQEELWVCGDRRGSLLLFQDQMNGKETEDENGLVKKGSTKVCDVILQPISYLFGVHGKQGVTSVYAYQGLLYSTGRDGCVRVFRVCATPSKKLESSVGHSVESREQLQLEVLRVQRACKGMEWLERIMILDPEIPLEDENECETEKLDKWCFRDGEQKVREARFVIVGFHAVHFVVWDPVRQERLLAVPCGGGHRSWSLWPSQTGVWPGYGALVFIKQGAVLALQPPDEALCWAGKAGRTGGLGLREGIHGKGIGCVCRLGRIEAEGGLVEREGRHWEVVVTGGEDTSLTVLAVHLVSGNIKVLSVITDHISSVRTVTAVTHPEGGSKQSLSALLVSAGGRAQIQCYRLSVVWDRQRLAPSCQVIQVAQHRLDGQWEKRRNRHKTVKMDPETRYMSMAVVDVRTDCVLLALSCSDGAVRLFSVSEVKCQIELLWETFYHQRCVLSVATCSLEDDKGNRYLLLFSAATDGKIAAWQLTEALFSSTDTTRTELVPCLDFPAHQSGINSLAVWTEKLGQEEGGCLVTVASGGDDGQLTVSTVQVQVGGGGGLSQTAPCSNQLRLHLCSQSCIPLAHAAPVTALKLLSPGLVVSTSSDQRVYLWRVDSSSISQSAALCCHVADAAGLAVWQGEDAEGSPGCELQDKKDTDMTDQTVRGEDLASTAPCERGWVLVCGQGFQLLRVRNR